MKSKSKGLMIIGACIIAGSCFAKINSTAEINAFQQEREAKISQYTKNIDSITNSAEKKVSEGTKYLHKRAEAITNQSDQPIPPESDNATTTEESGQTDTSTEIPNCTNCNDPKYNYHSNFLYDSKGNKIERLYPTRCKCIATTPAPIVLPTTNSTKQSTSQQTTNWGIKY